MAQDVQDAPVEQPIVQLLSPRSLLVLVGLGAVVAAIIALGLASHRPGVPTVSPGKISPTANQTALNILADRLQSFPHAHHRAAMRQADANG